MSMIQLKTTPVSFTPTWYLPAKVPAFMIRPGDVVEREMFEAEMSGQYDAARVMRYEISAAFLEGINFLLADAPEQLEALLQIDSNAREIESHNGEVFLKALGVPDDERAAYMVKEQRSLPPEELQTLEEAERVLKQHWPSYRALVAQQERRQALVPLVAFRRFCVGWQGVTKDGVATAFARGMDGLVTLDALQGVPQNDMKAAGLFAYQLLYASTEERSRKNSSAPSNAGEGRKTSHSGGASKKAGRSRASGGRRTRGS